MKARRVGILFTSQEESSKKIEPIGRGGERVFRKEAGRKCLCGRVYCENPKTSELKEKQTKNPV